jgi:hypothetical protein
MGLLNKNGLWWLSITLISVSILLLSTTIMWNTTKKENIELQVQLKNLTSEKQIKDSLMIDSLQTELFILKNEIGKWEMSAQFLKEYRPNEYDLMMNYKNTQTE